MVIYQRPLVMRTEFFSRYHWCVASRRVAQRDRWSVTSFRFWQNA